jgi:hypothetical protein
MIPTPLAAPAAAAKSHPGRIKLELCLLLLLAASFAPPRLHAQMNPYFTAITTPVPKRTLMLMFLPDFQNARDGSDFFTFMGMAEYGVTPRWTAGMMVEGKKPPGSRPPTADCVSTPISSSFPTTACCTSRFTASTNTSMPPRCTKWRSAGSAAGI